MKILLAIADPLLNDFKLTSQKCENTTVMKVTQQINKIQSRVTEPQA
jgi:hypothetical protein